MNKAHTWIVKFLWKDFERELFTEISVRSYVIGLESTGCVLGKDFTVERKIYTC